MSKNLSRAVQSFVTSVVCGKDVVPRLSIVNVGRLIDQMVCLTLFPVPGLGFGGKGGNRGDIGFGLPSPPPLVPYFPSLDVTATALLHLLSCGEGQWRR